MSWQKPPESVLWRAIAIYLRHAYDGPANAAGIPASVPSAVRSKLEVLRATDPSDIYESNIFEHDPVPAPKRYNLRLGSRSYPHMKLTIDALPNGRGHLFRADTHDGHIRVKPGSRDAKAFEALVRENHATAEAIESEWEAQGLPTFKAYLREDVAKRQMMS